MPVNYVVLDNKKIRKSWSDVILQNHVQKRNRCRYFSFWSQNYQKDCKGKIIQVGINDLKETTRKVNRSSI